MGRGRDPLWWLIVTLAWACFSMLPDGGWAGQPQTPQELRPGEQRSPGALPPGRQRETNRIEVIVNGQVKKAWSDEALHAILDQEYILPARVAGAVSLARFLQESGLSLDHIALVLIFGEPYGREPMKLEGDDLTRLERLLLFAAVKGWNLGEAKRDEGAPPYVVRFVARIEVALK